jgi:hypothetical protein
MMRRSHGFRRALRLVLAKAPLAAALRLERDKAVAQKEAAHVGG